LVVSFPVKEGRIVIVNTMVDFKGTMKVQ